MPDLTAPEPTVRDSTVRDSTVSEPAVRGPTGRESTGRESTRAEQTVAVLAGVGRDIRVYLVCAEVPPHVVGGLGRYAERMMTALGGLGIHVKAYGTAGWRRGEHPPERIGDVTLHRVRTVGSARRRSRVGRLLPGPAGRAWENATRIAGLVWFNGIAALHILRAAGAGRFSRAGGAGQPERLAAPGAVVAVHDWMGCIAGLLCRTLGRLPVVFHVHTREINSAPASRRSPVAVGIAALEKTMARRASLIVVPSEGMRDDLAAAGWPSARIRVVPHGHEDDDLARLRSLPAEERHRLCSAVRHRYLPVGAGALVVFAGRLADHKGVRTLIRATPRLVDGYRSLQGKPLRVVLLGAGAPRTGDNARTADLIERMGVTGQVTAGYRFLPASEVFSHFLAADVCVFPSTYEPFGLVAIEAMALGRPVVVGPGYSAEVVGDAAVRCRHDSPDEVAEAVLGVLGDPARAAWLGERGAHRVRERYSWHRTAQLTIEAYAEAASDD